MKISVLDALTLGKDIDLSPLQNAGETEIFENTVPEEVPGRIKDSEVIIVNKIKLNKTNLSACKKLKLICVAATGYDNIDTEYCKSVGIQVRNVVGYSTNSVAQTTVASVLELCTHIRSFTDFVASGKYSVSGVANKLEPVYNELYGKTWGIIGLGNIGKRVARVAEAFGCRVIAFKRTPDPDFNCVDLKTLCRKSDIISIHIPLGNETRGLIGEKEINEMKQTVILYNAARGAVTDEKAIADAVKSGRIAGFGCDVYSIEPFGKDHPMYEIKNYTNVCLTPHMAWGSYEARCLCIEEIVKNIKAFENGEMRNVVN